MKNGKEKPSKYCNIINYVKRKNFLEYVKKLYLKKYICIVILLRLVF